MLTVFSPEHRRHRATAELIDGRLAPPVEVPERAELVLGAVRAAGLGPVIEPDADTDAPGLRAALERVHAPRFLDFLAGAYDTWRAEGRDGDALPLAWPTRHMRQIEPVTIDCRLSYYSFDAGTPVTAGTWAAATGSARVALTGAYRLTDGAAAAFALCRPPGHHASGDVFGGYCYLNNAAVAVQALVDGGARRVAVLDVDYHHGNGTQTIFWERGDVFVCSIHADPRQEYPFFLGHADETGAGLGDDANRNLPLPWGAGWEEWSAALATAIAAVAAHRPDAVVVSLGVDTHRDDPISQFRLDTPDYLKVGAAIAGLGRPTLFVLEGGYAIAAIGANVVNVLTGFADRQRVPQL